MFATLRTEDRDGEVVCISSTNQPPQPGQNSNHFACDGCRAKKLKCTGHRFGCQRCRDRNLVCTYSSASQPKRRKAARLSTSHRISSLGVPTPSSAEELTQACRQSPGSTKENRGSSVTLLSESASSRDTQVTNTFVQQPSAQSTLSSHDLSSEGPATAPPEFPDLSIPEYIESGFHDFDMDELLEADLSLSEQDTGGFELDAALTSSTSSEDGIDTRESSFANSRTSSDGIEWAPAQHGKRKLAEDSQPQLLASVKRASTSMSSKMPTSSASFSPNFEPKVSAAESPILDLHRPRESPAPRTEARSKHTSPCRCIAVTLTHLEKIHGQEKINTLCVAEKSLYCLKKSISQCQALSQCRSCRSPSRVMTFLILLVEKMVSILEDIAATWETNTLASSSEQNAAQMDMYGHAHKWIPIHLGQYQVDTVQERCEVFGFLILLQARHLGAFVESLRSYAERENWESHQTALRPATLRIRDLQETLGGMASGLFG